MLAFKPPRASAAVVTLFALILALVAVVPSVARPQTVSAQGVPPYCASGYVSNGVTCMYAGGSYCPSPGYPGCVTGYGTCANGTPGCINGVCQGGYSSNGLGGCTLNSYNMAYGGACAFGTVGCVNGVCTAGYAANGLGGCTLSGVATGCVLGAVGCVNGVCTAGYAPNGVGGCTLSNASTTCVAGSVGCVGGVCITGYVPNGAGGCVQSVTPYAANTCVAGSPGCVNGVCTAGYVTNGAGGCTAGGAGICAAGMIWNGSTCQATGTAISGAITQTPLNAGCNLVVVLFGAGATPQQVVSATANPSAVQAVWGWDNVRQRWMGYFPGQPSGASDLLTLPARAAVFVCVSSPTTLSAP